MKLLKYIEDNKIDEITKRLSKADVSQKSLNCALFSACYRNNLKAVEILLEAGANVNYECNLGTPLTEALEEENFEIAKILLEAGAVPSFPVYSEVSLPLMIAAEKGNLAMVKLLINFEADANQIHQSTGSFALASAAGVGHKNVFDYLAPLTNSELRKEAEEILPIGIRTKELEENADPLVKELSDFVFDKNLEGIKGIIKKGVDVNGLDEIGNTALCLAVSGGDPEIVRALLEAGADPNLTPEPEPDEDESKPPLSLGNNADITKLLIDAGANTNFQNSSGDTILIMTAYRWGAFENMKVLLENGADINIKNNEGETALMYAAKDKDNLDKVKLLIKSGVDLNIQDNDGNTALSIAREAGNTEIIELLLEAGAKEN